MTIAPVSNFPVITPPAAAGGTRVVDRATQAPEASLRSALSSEERDFFEQAQRLGPVSYGRSGVTRAPVDVPLGQHLDLKA